SLGTSLASSLLEKRNDDAVITFDEPGLRNRALQCDKIFFTKPQAYATVNHALTVTVTRNPKRWCLPAKCVTFPAPFMDQRTLFRVPGKYKIFPIKPDGTLYMGGHPGSYFVVYNDQLTVAGILIEGYLGYRKCLYNDQISPPRTPFMTRVRTKFNEITRYPFTRVNQPGTATSESATNKYSRLNPFAKKKSAAGQGR
ncbi:hypothetical protein GcM3_115024, partial [Golovinomyces cichoracearum]